MTWRRPLAAATIASLLLFGAATHVLPEVATGTLTVAPPQPVRITDQRGRTHTFTSPARRVVPIAIPLLWHYAFVDAGASHIVAANPVAVTQLRDGIADRVLPGLASLNTGITRGGTFTPNVEALLALRPDAVFQWADRGAALIDVLDAAGLPAIGVKNTNNESDIDTWIQLSGRVAGRVARADSLVRYMQRGNARFDSIARTIPAAARPRVLVLTEYSKTIAVNGPTSYAGRIVERAGGHNVATVDGTIGIEQVLAWDPEVILLTPFELNAPSALFDDPRWRTTSAARARRVYKLPFGVTRWGGYGPESPLLLTWLANLLYPSRPPLALRAEMRAAYQSLFGYRASDTELDRALQASQNGSSAYYDRIVGPAAR